MYITSEGKYKNPKPYTFRYAPPNTKKPYKFKYQLKDEMQYNPTGVFEQELISQVSKNELKRRTEEAIQSEHTPEREAMREREFRQAREFKDSRPDIFFDRSGPLGTKTRNPSGFTHFQLSEPMKNPPTFQEFLYQQAQQPHGIRQWPPVPEMIPMMYNEPISNARQKLEDLYDEEIAKDQLDDLAYRANEIENQETDDIDDLYDEFGLNESQGELATRIANELENEGINENIIEIEGVGLRTIGLRERALRAKKQRLVYGDKRRRR
jgi:hypothetical protein